MMLAPMEDVTDVSFRQICREQGADMVYTEFVKKGSQRFWGTRLLAAAAPEMLI